VWQPRSVYRESDFIKDVILSLSKDQFTSFQNSILERTCGGNSIADPLLQREKEATKLR